MKTFIILLIILVVIMFFTRPSSEKHQLAIADELVKSAQQGGLDSTAIVCWDFDGHNAEFVNQAKSNPEQARKQAAEEVAKTLEVKDFYLCNVGTVTLNNKRQNLTLGAFGHVFCTGVK